MGQGQRLYNPPGDDGLIQGRAIFGQGAINGRTKQGHLDKIIEVTGLERGVLPVVGETEKFAGALLHIGLAAQFGHGGEAQQRGSRTAPLAGETGQLAEITLAPGIDRAAVEAGEERLGEEPA